MRDQFLWVGSRGKSAGVVLHQNLVGGGFLGQGHVLVLLEYYVLGLGVQRGSGTS